MKNSAPLLTIAMLAITSSAWGQILASLAPLSLADIPATEPAADPAPGDSPQAHADDPWRFSLSVPIWLVGFDGDLIVKGNELTGDDEDSGSDFLESELNGALALHLEAEKNRFGLLLDTMYLARSAEGTVDLTAAEGTFKGFIGEIGAFYTIVPPAPDKRGWGMFRLDALGGLRVSALELGLETDAIDDEASRTFWDPYIGARLEVGLTNWLSFKLRGDVGGFGIDAWHTSDFSYNIDTALEFHLATWFDLGIGYRWLDYDIEFGSDSSLNATLSGPVVEIKFNF